MVDESKRRQNFLSLSKLECGPNKSALGKLAYFRHFRIGLNTTKFEKTLIHFKSDVFAAVAVVDAKTPYFLSFLVRGRVSCSPAWQLCTTRMTSCKGRIYGVQFLYLQYHVFLKNLLREV